MGVIFFLLGQVYYYNIKNSLEIQNIILRFGGTFT